MRAIRSGFVSTLLGWLVGLIDGLRRLLRGTPGQLGEAEAPFFEEVPHWDMPDLAVDTLTIEPQWANPGEEAILAATVKNLGKGDANSAALIFQVDEMEISREAVGPLGASAQAEFNGYVVQGDGAKRQIIDGLYRTVRGETASGDSDWIKLKNGLPHNEGLGLKVDIFKADLDLLYSAVTHPYGVDPIEPKMLLGIFRSMDGGDSWKLVRGYGRGELDGSLYSPFIRVHPEKASLIYFGGVKLYKENIDSSNWAPQRVTGVHDDMQGFEFDPSDPDRYYVLNDGGVWRCTVSGDALTVKAVAGDIPAPCNQDLRVTEFYDFDASETNPNLMLGGTQDNGTVLYEGKEDWNASVQVRGGDGYYSLIVPKDNRIVYSQHQSLNSTWQSRQGGKPKTWEAILDKKGVPEKRFREGFLAVHPNNPNVVLSVGDQVYATLDALSGRKATWTAKGPKGRTYSLKKDNRVTRVAFQPKTFTWIAGTSKGQIWYSTSLGSSWSLLDSHPDDSAVLSMAFAPTDHRVLYVAYQSGKAWRRVQRLEWSSGGGWNGSFITDNLPQKHMPGNFPFEIRVICGDGHRADVAYVGTNKGVFRWVGTKATYESWTAYNDGLPLAKVNDLLVPAGRSNPVNPNQVDPRLTELRAATRGRGAWSVITGP